MTFALKPLRLILVISSSHIPVAVKILRRPMDDLDLSMQEVRLAEQNIGEQCVSDESCSSQDFDREVAVMRSVSSFQRPSNVSVD